MYKYFSNSEILFVHKIIASFTFHMLNTNTVSITRSFIIIVFIAHLFSVIHTTKHTRKLYESVGQSHGCALSVWFGLPLAKQTFDDISFTQHHCVILYYLVYCHHIYPFTMMTDSVMCTAILQSTNHGVEINTINATKKRHTNTSSRCVISWYIFLMLHWHSSAAERAFCVWF